MGELLKKLKRPFDGTWDAVEAATAVFERILLKHSVRNVLKFKSVSKYWQTVLSTKDFMLQHRDWSKKDPKYLVCYVPGEIEDDTVLKMHQMETNGSYTESYVIPELAAVDSMSIMCTFNGLICCESYVRRSKKSHAIDIFICNPATREVLKLPRGHPSVYIPIHGLLYSKQDHFYKIFKLFTDPIDVKDGYVQCEVYSSNTGSWKQLGWLASCPSMELSLPLLGYHVCVNEKLYWLIDNEVEFGIPPWIFTVDMDENFNEIELPVEGDASYLIEFRGRLCLVNYCDKNITLWLFEEEYDDWNDLGISKFPADWLNIAYVESVVAIGEEILFVYKDHPGFRHEVIYDVRADIWKDFSIAEDDKKKSIAVFPFFETLAPCSTLTGSSGI